jgi:hypothetical protein
MVGFVICSDKRHTPSGESLGYALSVSGALAAAAALDAMVARYAVMALGSLDSTICLDSPH